MDARQVEKIGQAQRAAYEAYNVLESIRPAGGWVADEPTEKTVTDKTAVECFQEVGVSIRERNYSLAASRAGTLRIICEQLNTADLIACAEVVARQGAEQA